MTSREQFEAWCINQCITDLGKTDSLGHYRSMQTRKLWKVWRASREAIEVEMPPSVTTAEIGPAVSHEKMIARLAVNGIKVKS